MYFLMNTIWRQIISFSNPCLVKKDITPGVHSAILSSCFYNSILSESTFVYRYSPAFFLHSDWILFWNFVLFHWIFITFYLFQQNKSENRYFRAVFSFLSPLSSSLKHFYTVWRKPHFRSPTPAKSSLRYIVLPSVPILFKFLLKVPVFLIHFHKADKSSLISPAKAGIKNLYRW